MTQSQKDALKWLRERGGDGVLMRGNVLLCSGEVAPFMWTTWKGLIEAGKAEQYRMGKGRRLRLAPE